MNAFVRDEQDKAASYWKWLETLPESEPQGYARMSMLWPVGPVSTEGTQMTFPVVTESPGIRIGNAHPGCPLPDSTPHEPHLMASGHWCGGYA